MCRSVKIPKYSYYPVQIIALKYKISKQMYVLSPHKYTQTKKPKSTNQYKTKYTISLSY